MYIYTQLRVYKDKSKGIYVRNQEIDPINSKFLAQSRFSLYIYQRKLVRELQMTALKIKIYFSHDDKCLATGERSEARRSLKMIRRAKDAKRK